MLSFNQLWIQMEHDRHASLLRQLKQELARDQHSVPPMPRFNPVATPEAVSPQRVKTPKTSPRRIRVPVPRQGKGRINYQSC